MAPFLLLGLATKFPHWLYSDNKVDLLKRTLKS